MNLSFDQTLGAPMCRLAFLFIWGSMARRSKYTPELVKKLCHAIELGATYELACKYAGISYETFNEWRKEKVQFSEEIKTAEGKATVGWLTMIEQSAADGQWTAAAWKLERRYPQSYGKTIQEQQHTGRNGEALTVNFAVVPHREAIAEQSE